MTLRVGERLLNFPVALKAKLLNVLDVSLMDFQHVPSAFGLGVELPLAVDARVVVAASLLSRRSVAPRDVIEQHVAALEEDLTALWAQLLALRGFPGFRR